jgi:ribonuclease E
MTTKRMLIDASHTEETRVLIVNGNRLEDFDVEVDTRRPLKGNIYLAKVTRVEPSLQAAFVDYGGNRHGFLAFSEIHPDYYQIPVADREALLAEERAEADQSADSDDDIVEEGAVETLGGDDSEEVEARRPVTKHRRYKIQEVIKRRQILLIQVVKEERGTKGAALTTYLSLAGRYCVLMPNTDRGGGISRKIGSIVDRKKLKKIVAELGVPEGMAVIVRTAGSDRSRSEIRRDYDYLLRLWNQIRDQTLGSIAPSLVHEEGDLIKRSIRDLYSNDIEEIIVHGEDGYRMAKDFMKILIPSHAKKVQKYKDVEVPLAHNYRIENQLEVIHSTEVHMKSGAYIVINPTEALVAIDVNSGRSTKERNIEETALKTNLEAAEEIARQLKLRDLAGLIVIDFIDMEINRNQSKVERAVKEAMRSDRARIQIGRISPFGLLEMSRQRLRPSLIETSSEPCPYCNGSGLRRSTETTVIEVLRALEEEGLRKPGGEMTVFVPTEVALYLLNRKRDSLAELEQRFGLKIILENDDSLIPPNLRIERDGEVIGAEKTSRTPTNAAEADGVEEGAGRKRRRRRPRNKRRAEGENSTETTETTENNVVQDNEAQSTEASASNDGDGEEPKRRRRGRRGGRRRRRRPEEDAVATSNAPVAQQNAADNPPSLIEGPETTELLPPPSSDDGVVIALPDASVAPAENSGEGSGEKPEAKTEKPKHRRRARKPKVEEAANDTGADNEPKSAAETSAPIEAKSPEDKPKRTRRRKPKAADADAEAKTATDVAPEAEAAPKASAKPKRRRVSKKATETPAPEQQAAEKPAPKSAETPEADALKAAEAAKTTVIKVGGDAEKSAAPSRSGWWNKG